MGEQRHSNVGRKEIKQEADKKNDPLFTLIVPYMKNKSTFNTFSFVNCDMTIDSNFSRSLYASLLKLKTEPALRGIYPTEMTSKDMLLAMGPGVTESPTSRHMRSANESVQSENTVI